MIHKFLKLISIQILLTNFLIFSGGFESGTLVKTPDGYAQIQSLRTGDSVISCNLESSICEPKNVIGKSIAHSLPSNIALISVGNELIKALEDQKFYLPLEKIWVKALDLEIGDVLTHGFKSNLEITGLSFKALDTEFYKELDTEDLLLSTDFIPGVFYDISVEDYKNFCVSKEDILAHNFAIVLTVSFIIGELAPIIGGGLVLGGAAIIGDAIWGSDSSSSQSSNSQYKNYDSSESSSSHDDYESISSSQSSSHDSSFSKETNGPGSDGPGSGGPGDGGNGPQNPKGPENPPGGSGSKKPEDPKKSNSKFGHNLESATVKKYAEETKNTINRQSGNPGNSREIKGPSESKAWDNYKPYRQGTKTNGLKGKDREYYEWDHTHKHIETYDRHGNHKGVRNPDNGELDISKRVNDRKIKL